MPDDGQAVEILSLQNGGSQFRRLMEVLPSAAYTCDADGLITSYNPPATELWGRQPRLNDRQDRYCGSHKLFSTDGTLIPHERCWTALALLENCAYHQRDIVVERPDGSRRNALAHAHPLCDESGRLVGAVNVLVDVTQTRSAEEKVRALATELELLSQRTASLQAATRDLYSALACIKTLRGLIPICSWCNKIRDEMGFWQRLEIFLRAHTGATFTHGICPDCARKHGSDSCNSSARF